MTSDSIVAETATRIFRDLCDPQHRQPRHGRRLEGAGVGGAGGGRPAARLGAGGAGRRAAPTSPTASPCCARRAASPCRCRWPRRCWPAGCWRQAGISSPKGAMSCGPAREGDQVVLAKNGTLSGRLRAVAFARDAKHLARARRARRRRRRRGTGRGRRGCASPTAPASPAMRSMRCSFDGVRPVAVKDAPAGLDARRAAADGRRRARHADGGRAGGDPRPRRSPTPTSASPSSGRSPSSRPCSTTWRGSPARWRRPLPRRARPPMPSPVPRRLRRGRVPRSGIRQDPRRRGGRRGRGHRPPGAGRHRLHQGAHAAPLHAAAVGLARRLRQRELWAVKLGNLVAAKGADALWPMLAAR